MDVVVRLPLFPIGLASLLASHGLQKGSLSRSGAAAAFIVGGLMCAVRLRTFAVSLVGFYLIGSRATKVGKDTKRKLEEGYDVGSQRGAFQVICNSFAAFLGSVVWNAAFASANRDAFAGIMAQMGGLLGVYTQGNDFDTGSWCAVDPSIANGWSRYLVFLALGHFACCLGDTLASEIGILSKKPPILITTLKVVPPGTNGGLSLLGTAASAMGGGVMGIIAAISMLLENPACRGESIRHIGSFIFWGFVGGFTGSLIDSLLGATIQETRYSTKKSHILTDDSTHVKDKDVRVVSGLGILTNNQVNLASSTLTALLVAKLAA